MDKLPWGVLIDCGVDKGYSGSHAIYANTRFICLYSRYSGGGFIGGRIAAVSYSGQQEHWAVTPNQITYSNGILSIYTASSLWTPDRIYNVYFIDDEET